MIDSGLRVRVAGSVVDRVMLLLQGISAFFLVASAVEVAWMERSGGTRTGAGTPVPGSGRGAL